MSQNNLRIVVNNMLTAVNGVTNANSLNEYKSQYDAGTTFTLTASVSGKVAVVAVLAEDTAAVTMTAAGVAVVESTSSTYNNSTSTGYGGVKYVTVYIDTTPLTQITVTFNKAVKVSKFIVGSYWSPKYNTSFGVQVGYEDTTNFERLQSGDLYSTVSPRYKTMQFDLQYLDESEKFTLFDIVKSVGKTKSMFVSIFPQDTDKAKEQMYSLYGRMSSPQNISYTMYSIYASSMQLEEF